jgi:hypothetical protein
MDRGECVIWETTVLSMTPGFFNTSLQKCHSLGLAVYLVFAPVAAAAQTLSVSRADCTQLAPYTGGDADYVPGVDANGDPVAPADIGLSPSLPDTIEIPLQMDVLRRFHLPAGSRLLQGKAFLGLVSIKDGKAYLDGAPLDDAETGALAALCRKR